MILTSFGFLRNEYVCRGVYGEKIEYEIWNVKCISKLFITFFTFVELYFDEMIEYGVWGVKCM